MRANENCHDHEQESLNLPQEKLEWDRFRRKQLSGSASSWYDSERTPTQSPSSLAPGVALGSLKERACVLRAARSPPVLQVYTQRATEPR
jgi:hypothetical protein